MAEGRRVRSAGERRSEGLVLLVGLLGEVQGQKSLPRLPRPSLVPPVGT